MVDVSIVIPVAPYHRELSARAIASAKAQTAPCVTLVIEDTDGRGAGWARNEGLKQVQTHFVCFLDADDTIEPNFVARCQQVIQPNTYVYTDWYEGDKVVNAPDRAWRLDGKWHVVTTLLETSAVRAVGAFDEKLPVAEDAHFYWALTRNQVCGIHLSEPLFRYGAEGKRARAYMMTDANGNLMLENGQPIMKPEMRQMMQALAERYNGMGCCGDEINKIPPSGEREPGYVLVIANWGGNRDERGQVTGKRYGRIGNYKEVWIDPLDAKAEPNKFPLVPQMNTNVSPYNPPQFAPMEGVFTDMNKLAGAYMNAVIPPAPKALTAEELAQTLPAAVRPNVSKISALVGSRPTAEFQGIQGIKEGFVSPPPPTWEEITGEEAEQLLKVIDPPTPAPKKKRGRTPKAK